ncbi:MAG: adenine DNA glycosylase [Gammaproteobacteria bacterium]|nr:MAG: adenine DNA glycosylase [Gammaproteobacteria bacterium]
MADGFSAALIGWHRREGRHDLPWQRDPTPYRVWVSEVMLQQTRVGTVLPYFVRFTDRFPDVRALAAADSDEVLHLWSGLGYYARARNLHRAARMIVERHGGRFPETFDEVATLPGIGRSTAGAILALSMGQRHPILDGNVKRVLCRYHAVTGWPGSAETGRRLWELAAAHTPEREVSAYTQAIMDLGATLCTRARPDCDRCPLREGCLAFRNGSQMQFPEPRPSRALPLRRCRYALIRRPGSGELLLQRRPPAGVWGGLCCLPELPDGVEPRAWCRERFGLEVSLLEPRPGPAHTFTHFRLQMQLQPMEVRGETDIVMEQEGLLWYKEGRRQAVGIPAPVRRIIRQLELESPP